jgi:acyl-CoA thioesterase I
VQAVRREQLLSPLRQNKPRKTESPTTARPKESLLYFFHQAMQPLTFNRSRNTAAGHHGGILLAVAFWTIACSMTAVASAADIAAFGDSITSGTGSRSGGYPAQLTNRLNRNAKPVLIANHGKLGELTAAGAERIDAVLAGSPARIILIMEGTNDVWRGVPVETTRANLQTMINKAKAAGITPVLSTLPPSTKNDSPTLIPQIWNPMIRSLARRNGISLADSYAALAANWQTFTTDGIHPNDQGYRVIAATWYAAIAPMIASSGAVEADGHAQLIATLASGSPLEPRIGLLREFRDTCLFCNAVGRWLIETYYHFAPSIADFISHHQSSKPAARAFLYPAIALCYLVLKVSPPVQMAIAALTGSAGMGLAVAGRRRRIAIARST